MRSEHSPGGMFNGAEVIVKTSSHHGVTCHRGKIVSPPVSTPAAHLVMEVQERDGRRHRRLIFCAAIEWIEPVDGLPARATP
jgi:hypothetical protein